MWLYQKLRLKEKIDVDASEERPSTALNGNGVIIYRYPEL